MKSAANIAAERLVLAALLQDGSAATVFEQLTAKDFVVRFYGKVFRVVDALREDGQPICLTTVRDNAAWDDVERAELDGLCDPLEIIRATKERDVAAAVQIIRRDSRMRQVRKVADELAQANGDATGLAVDLKTKLDSYFDSLRASTEAPGVSAATIRPSLVYFFWRRYIPLGKITVLDGDPDLGKSLLTTDLVARATSKALMPDGSLGLDGGAVLLNAEDDEGDTIVPRLISAGADLDRVRILKTVTTREGEREIEIPGDIDAIRDAALAVDARLIIIDPLMAFLSLKANSWRDQDVRRALRPLAQLAGDIRAAIVVIRHLNKSNVEANPLYRGGGSIGIIGAARSGLLVGTDPDDASGETRILAVTKSNLSRKAPSLRYQIVGDNNNIPFIKWLGESEHRAATIINNPEGEQQSATEECKQFIVSFLEDGARPAAEVIKTAKAAGYSERTIDRAKVRARVEAYRSGFGKGGTWMWNVATKAANT